MADIKIIMKDGKERIFQHEGRSGGSYTKEIRYEGGFAIIKDEWYRETSIPSSEIKEVIVTPNRY